MITYNKHNKIKFICFAFCVVLISFLLFSCGGKTEDKTPTQPLPKTPEKIQTNKVVGQGRIEPETKIIQLSLETSGVVKKLYKREGDSVKAGELILELNNDIERSLIAENQSALAAAKAQIDITLATIEAAKTKLENAKLKYQRAQNLVAKQAETQQNLDNAEADFLSAQKETQRLDATLIANKKQIEIEQMRELTNTARLEQKYLRSPFTGVLLSVNITEGAAALALVPIAELAPTSHLTALCEIDELFADKVAVGQKAIIRPLGGAEELATGTVIYAAAGLKKKSLFSEAGGDMEDRRVREVRIRLDKNALLIGKRIEGVITVQ